MKFFYWILPTIICILAACGSSSGGGTYTVKSSTSAVATTVSIGTNEIGNTFGSPTALKQKFYAAWISPNEDCTNAVLLQDYGDAGHVVDFYSGEVIFSGSPADGTYKCLISKSSDIQTFIPDAAAEGHWTAAVCSSTTTYTEDIFKADTPIITYLNKDGTTINGQGTYTAPVEQVIYSYITTNPSAIIAKGAHAQQVLTLATPLIVPGQGTLYTDFTGQVSKETIGATTVCWLEQPVVGFR
ncbi:MAG: hypothetical protein NTY22_01550 [Proteobacteria bacterium]|nr:hypothetical protein [Pseudomonadota bacterium]